MKRARLPEYRLLLSCARKELAERHRSAIDALLDRPLDWRKVLELASWHRVSALLLRHLRRAELAPRVPGGVLRELQSRYDENVFRYLRLQAELRRVVTALEAAGIPVIVLKGAALAEPVYGEPGLRPMRDLDLLVAEQDLDRAYGIVQGLGFAPLIENELEQVTKSLHRHYPELVSEDGSTCFELHRHVVRADSPLHFDVSGFWARTRKARIAGGEMRVLAPEDLLIHLGVNFFLDCRSRYPSRAALGRLVDVSETLQRYREVIDWDLFMRKVSEYRLGGVMVCSLLTVERLLETAAPAEVRGRGGVDDIDDSMVELFIDSRVLRESVWFFHELVEPADLALPNVLKAAVRRLFPSVGQLRYRYRRCADLKRPVELYRRHLSEASQFLSRSILRPGEFLRDLRVERWMFSLFSLYAGA